MKNENSFMTPISRLFMLIAVSPYIGIKFGNLSLLAVAPFLLYTALNAYRFYKNKAIERDITYAKALEEDLPDMSPIHFVFFLLIAAPIFMLITGGELKGFIGIAVLWVVYTAYYYGFRK